MSEHTPPHRHPPLPASPDPVIDVVPGEPPVPISVWRTVAAGEQDSIISDRLAYRLTAAYSRPGEAVVDLTPGHALTSACQRGGRAHHKAWFTDAASLIIGPTTPAQPDDAHSVAGETAAGHGEIEPPEVSAWFGDDLTDPQLPPPGSPVTAVPTDGNLRGATSLLVACWPLDSDDAAARVRLAWLLAACAELLRPGGCLVLIVGVPVGMTATPEDFGPLVAAAAGAGLGYLQHIVAVTAQTDGDHFVYHITAQDLAQLARTSGEQWVLHARVHADLLVFTPAGGDSRA